jgi:hypothetical protein
MRRLTLRGIVATISGTAKAEIVFAYSVGHRQGPCIPGLHSVVKYRYTVVYLEL